MCNGKSMVLVIVWNDVGHGEPVASFEVLANKKGEIFRCVIVIEPVTKFVHHFIKDDGTMTRVLAGSEMMNVFVVTLAAGAVVCDSVLPFQEKPVDTTAASYILGEPVSEGVGELLQGTRNHIP
jgi:hypothetical protein